MVFWCMYGEDKNVNMEKITTKSSRQYKRLKILVPLLITDEIYRRIEIQNTVSSCMLTHYCRTMVLRNGGDFKTLLTVWYASDLSTWEVITMCCLLQKRFTVYNTAEILKATYTRWQPWHNSSCFCIDF